MRTVKTTNKNLFIPVQGDWSCELNDGFLRGYFNIRSSGLVPNVRLPADVTPFHYAITVAPDLTEGTLRGDFAVDVTVANGGGQTTVSELTMHILDISVEEDTITVTDSGGQVVPVAYLGFDFERQFLKIGLGSEQAALSVLSVSGRYEGGLDAS